MKVIKLLLLLLMPFIIQAQDFSAGVRIGLNFSNFSGPSEIDLSGNELEEFRGNTGFVVGGIFNIGFTDLFGIRTEVLFSQKGARRIYDGASSVYLSPDTDQEVLATGNRDYVLRVDNSYIDIPVAFYVKPIDKVKIFAGANVGFLVRSVGFGELIFNGEAGGQVPVEFTTTLNHDYRDDEGSLNTPITSSTDFSVNGNEIRIPTESNAYQLDFAERPENAYRGIDVGLLGGISYQINGSLFISVMYNLGLVDVTTNEADLAYSDTNAGQRLFNADVDKNRALQVSIGFEF